MAAAVATAEAAPGPAADARESKDPLPDERVLSDKAAFALQAKSDTGYVGLHNQGATCYLNSLVQALFMTAPLRRALFAWRFAQGAGQSAEFSIPLQLQTLFARLALTRRAAVDTDALTRSFRWDPAESFRQHDVQELMRVLFDALERSLPGQRLVSDLYEGRAVDFIRCAECGFVRERADTFMDVSLVVTGARTLLDALRNYVAPERLTGDNQWRCGGCARKVDAEKGLRFAALPPILTVQLKRFVYDPLRRARVKLNDALVFDEALDMAPFLDEAARALNPATRFRLSAVLTHSGTAAGGHYFAFVRCPRSGRWVEFNDSLVRYLPDEAPLRAAFGGENKSATSAYMLIYHREAAEAAAAPVAPASAGSSPLREEALSLLPQDVREAVEAEDAAWEREREELERERRMLELNVLFEQKERRFRFDQDTPLAVAEDEVRRALGLAQRFAPEQVRLRMFAVDLGVPQAVFTGRGAESLHALGFRRSNALVLETREREREFPAYNPKEIPLRLRRVTPENVARLVEESALPLVVRPGEPQADTVTVRVERDVSLAELRAVAGSALGVPPPRLRLVRLVGDRCEVLRADEARLDALDVAPGAYLYCEDTAHDLPPEVIAAARAQAAQAPQPAVAVADSDAGASDQDLDSQGDEKAQSVPPPPPVHRAVDLVSAPEAAASARAPPPAAAELGPDACSLFLTVFEESRCQITLEFNNPDAPVDPARGTVFDLQVRVSRNQTLRQLKRLIAPVVNIPEQEFRLLTSSNGQHFKDEGRTLAQCNLTDHGIVFLERGRPLKRDEFQLRFFLYQPDAPAAKDQFDFLFELVVAKGALVSELKAQVLRLLNETRPDGKRGNVFGISFVRLRDKGKTGVGRIFQSNLTVAKAVPRLKDGLEVAVQKIEEEENITAQHKSIFVRQWHADREVLGKKEELLVFARERVGVLRDLVARRSGIPREQLGFTKGPSATAVTKEGVKKLVFHSKLLPDDSLINAAPLTIRDGDLVIYRDEAVALAKAAAAAPSAPGAKPAERKTFGRGGVSVTTSRVAPPERALRIYASQEEREEADRQRAARAAGPAPQPPPSQ